METLKLIDGKIYWTKENMLEDLRKAGEDLISGDGEKIKNFKLDVNSLTFKKIISGGAPLSIISGIQGKMGVFIVEWSPKKVVLFLHQENDEFVELFSRVFGQEHDSRVFNDMMGTHDFKWHKAISPDVEKRLLEERDLEIPRELKSEEGVETCSDDSGSIVVEIEDDGFSDSIISDGDDLQQEPFASLEESVQDDDMELVGAGSWADGDE